MIENKFFPKLFLSRLTSQFSTEIRENENVALGFIYSSTKEKKMKRET